ncbi:hypothetical protein KIN20_001119 [Parelaphostrongylus tenuis]|uniref:LIM zinc-binding domain-containing protein n=1 Tax=Parelaphostrongylus tenuis TaxID=148309 RepID=A0AAD5MEB3_PARTN|nr:hypothetical protein KIN20_001119 [Parelaphostrongylus tenuis]
MVKLRKLHRGKKERSLVICPGCNKSITKEDTEKKEAVYVLGRVWHLKHLACQVCKVPIADAGCRVSPLNKTTPICTDCYMEIYHPPCTTCRLPLRETCLEAMGKKYHHECFRCFKCHGPMPDGKYYILNDNVYDEDCYFSSKSTRENDWI